MATTVDLQPVEVDIYVEQESDNVIRFQLKKLSGVTWVPEDISLDTVVFTVRDDFGGTLMFQYENEPADHSDGVNGYTDFALLRTDLDPGDRTSDYTWKYEVRRIIAVTEEEIVYLKGKLKMMRTVGMDDDAVPAP